MFSYKDRELNIDQTLIDKYKEVRGRDLNCRDIGIYLHAAYIRDSSDPVSYAFSLTEEELNDTLTDMIKKDIYIHS